MAVSTFEAADWRSAAVVFVPGGLGLHLVRQMADEVEYDYNEATRESRITLRISSAGVAARRAAAMRGGDDARD